MWIGFQLLWHPPTPTLGGCTPRLPTMRGAALTTICNTRRAPRLPPPPRSDARLPTKLHASAQQSAHTFPETRTHCRSPLLEQFSQKQLSRKQLCFLQRMDCPPFFPESKSDPGCCLVLFFFPRCIGGLRDDCAGVESVRSESLPFAFMGAVVVQDDARRAVVAIGATALVGIPIAEAYYGINTKLQLQGMYTFVRVKKRLKRVGTPTRHLLRTQWLGQTRKPTKRPTYTFA